MPVVVVILLIALYIYWLLGKKYLKDSNSLFDLWFLTGAFSFLVSRIAYIVENWSEYGESAWFYLPYERYGDDIYLFRLMPWSLFNVFDGGFHPVAAFVTFVFIFFLLSQFYKRWNWKEMYKTISTPVFLILSFSLIAIDFLNESTVNMLAVYALAAINILYLVLLRFGNYVLRNKTMTRERFDEILFVVILLSSIVLTILLLLSYVDSWVDGLFLVFYVISSLIMIVNYYVERVQQYRSRVKERKIKSSRIRKK